MIELPEAIVLAKQLTQALSGKTVKTVLPPSSPHKFCWFSGDPAGYDGLLRGHTLQQAAAYGGHVEICFDRDVKLSFNDGTAPRLGPLPKRYQLAITFTDGEILFFTVAMYGGIFCYTGENREAYFLKNKNGPSPLSDAFDEAYFVDLAASVKQNLSVKAFLATQQRIVGLGNGVLQDILFSAKINPKRKLRTLSEFEIKELFYCVKNVLREMVLRGGRDTEKDLFGNPGGYRTLLSKKTYAEGCPICGGPVTKEAYLGGSVYYCPVCQGLQKGKDL